MENQSAAEGRSSEGHATTTYCTDDTAALSDCSSGGGAGHAEHAGHAGHAPAPAAPDTTATASNKNRKKSSKRRTKTNKRRTRLSSVGNGVVIDVDEINEQRQRQLSSTTADAAATSSIASLRSDANSSVEAAESSLSAPLHQQQQQQQQQQHQQQEETQQQSPRRRQRPKSEKELLLEESDVMLTSRTSLSSSSAQELAKLSETMDSIDSFGAGADSCRGGGKLPSHSESINDNEENNSGDNQDDDGDNDDDRVNNDGTERREAQQEATRARAVAAAPPPSFTNGSYAARLARKQREMVMEDQNSSSRQQQDDYRNNRAANLGSSVESFSEGAQISSPHAATRPPPQSFGPGSIGGCYSSGGDASFSSLATASTMGGRRALDVQAEIAAAQARARQSRQSREERKAASAPPPAAPLRPPPSGCLSKASAHSNRSGITSAGLLDASVQSQSQAGGSSVSVTSQNRSSASSSQNQQPGAYPTAGRAPFANSYMGGRNRLGPPALFGETVIAANVNHESLSSVAMGDLSYSLYSQHNPTVHPGDRMANSSRQYSAVSNQQRRLDTTNLEMEEEEDLSNGDLSYMSDASQQLLNMMTTRAATTTTTSPNNSCNHDDHNEAGTDGDSSNNNNDPTEIVAICVEEDDLENNIRDEIIRTAAQADVVELTSLSGLSMKQQTHYAIYAVIAIILVAVAVGVGVGYSVRREENGSDDTLPLEANVTSEVPSQSPTAVFVPTLQKVYEAGVLRCGIYETTGFDDVSGDRFGVDVDWCRAIAAAVMGRDEYEVQLVNVTFADRFQVLADDKIDVLAAGSTFTMARNVYETEVEMGLSFSTPFMYDGLRFAGVPKYVQCADNDMKNFFECREILACVVGGSSYHYILSQRLPKRQIQVVDGWQTLYGGLRDGLCNIIAAEGVSLGIQNVRAFGYMGNYTIGRSLYSKIPLSMVTRSDSPQWSDFVNAIINVILASEQAGITQNTSEKVSDLFISGAPLFGEQYANMFEDVVATIGNFDEMFERHASSAVPREGLTLLNNGTTALLFSHPFGLIINEGPGPTSFGTLAAIVERGKLRCAIRSGRPGFAQVSSVAGGELYVNETANITGLDVEFCRALSTSLFSGSVDGVEFFEAKTESDAFALLADGYVDVAAGMHWTLQNDVNEPSTGKGFSFSQPYFYGSDSVTDASDPTRVDDNLSLATREDDFQWSSFVYWLVDSTFFAEGNGISQRLSNSMPDVAIFGADFQRMLRDPILEFGNYGELYARNVEPFIPRRGRNLINGIRNPGPQMYPMPGYFR